MPKKSYPTTQTADLIAVPLSIYRKLMTHIIPGTRPLDVFEYCPIQEETVMLVPAGGKNIAILTVALQEEGYTFPFSLLLRWRKLNWPIGDLDCHFSPYGKCVYDEANDSVYDSCVYCGMSDKRR